MDVAHQKFLRSKDIECSILMIGCVFRTPPIGDRSIHLTGRPMASETILSVLILIFIYLELFVHHFSHIKYS